MWASGECIGEGEDDNSTVSTTTSFAKSASGLWNRGAEETLARDLLENLFIVLRRLDEINLEGESSMPDSEGEAGQTTGRSTGALEHTVSTSGLGDCATGAGTAGAAAGSGAGCGGIAEGAGTAGATAGSAAGCGEAVGACHGSRPLKLFWSCEPSSSKDLGVRG